MKKRVIKLMKRNLFFIFLFFTLFLFFLSFVFSVTWIGSPWETSYNGSEDLLPSLTFNLSQYINSTDDEAPIRFVFGEGTNISSTLNGSKEPSFYYWISLNSTTGILRINSTRDNETGQFNISLDSYNKKDESAGARVFSFIINATNDAPKIINLSSNYTINISSQPFLKYLYGSDEESHHPLIFEVNFTSCSPAAVSNRSAGEC
ncbi:MAG: hypothetical protein QXU40_00920, partial [Candidatus Pacearchaeota archaeon]